MCGALTCCCCLCPSNLVAFPLSLFHLSRAAAAAARDEDEEEVTTPAAEPAAGSCAAAAFLAEESAAPALLAAAAPAVLECFHGHCVKPLLRWNLSPYKTTGS